MTAFFSNKYLLFAIRLILGALFIYSALTKITDMEYFVKSLYNYKLLPEDSLNYIALLIPWLELVIGVFILAGIFVKESAVIGGVLMMVFIAAIASAVARGLNIECGCFGTQDGSRVGLLRIVEDLIVLLGFIWLAFYGPGILAVFNREKIKADKTVFPF